MLNFTFSHCCLLKKQFRAPQSISGLDSEWPHVICVGLVQSWGKQLIVLMIETSYFSHKYRAGTGKVFMHGRSRTDRSEFTYYTEKHKHVVTINSKCFGAIAKQPHQYFPSKSSWAYKNIQAPKQLSLSIVFIVSCNSGIRGDNKGNSSLQASTSASTKGLIVTWDVN